MRGVRKLAVIAMAVCFAAAGFAGVAGAKDLFTLNTSWQPEHETFAVWYAKEKGWDKEAGLDIQMHFFDSGMAQMEALPAKQWVLAGTGGVPMIFGNLRHGAQLIGIGNDESITNAILVRGDSPVMTVKGNNPKFPEVYGRADLIKGKTILCTTVSSGHYAMSKWLEVFGLTDKDVVIKNMDQAQAIAAFESGIGDMVALWAPNTYTGMAKGWKIAGDIRSCGASLPIVLVGDKEFCAQHPDIVAKFLKVYFRSIDAIIKDPKALVPEYKRFFTEWAGMDFDVKTAETDLLMHPVFSLKKQVQMLDNSKGESEVEAGMRGITEFFTKMGKIKPEERDKVLKSGYITNKYLKLAAQ